MKVKVLTSYSGDTYFRIDTENIICYTSESIANLLNLDVDLYNQLLVDKVIKHNKYSINSNNKDLSFKLNNIPKEIYLKRFKETFIKELTLAVMGGGTK